VPENCTQIKTDSRRIRDLLDHFFRLKIFSAVTGAASLNNRRNKVVCPSVSVDEHNLYCHSVHDNTDKRVTCKPLREIPVLNVDYCFDHPDIGFHIDYLALPVTGQDSFPILLVQHTESSHYLSRR
jgi:hypothetical protein